MKYPMLATLMISSVFGAKAEVIEETLFPHWRQSFDFNRIIARETTDAHDLVIFENELFGRVMVLDGAVQLTEADEPIYHEMLNHVPLLTHDDPRSVLVIGGGDGGSLREIVKHKQLERIVLVEIDPAVIDLSKKYFPKLSHGAFDDPRVEIVIADAAEYVKNSNESFDVIISDSTDPIGPGEVLFTFEFYQNCKTCLKKDGIFVNHAGVPFLQQEDFCKTKDNLSAQFTHVKPYGAPVATYVGGSMIFRLNSDRAYHLSEQLLKERLQRIEGATQLFYYNPSIHLAAFALPNFILQQLQGHPWDLADR